MRMHDRVLAVLTALVAGSWATGAQATDGYFQIGYGQKSVGMGGVGIALPQDALAAATNPAGMVIVGDRVDFGMEWFKPVRSSQITGNGAGANNTYDGNNTSSFLIPEFGYNKMVNANTSVGVSIYGNGGMDTNYSVNPFGAFGGMGASGVNLAQVFISPTFATKLNATNAVGISLNLAYQQFSADGLQPFKGISGAPNNLTSTGTDTSTGAGIRIGWTGQVTPVLTLGATYATKTYMSKFSNYSGLFAQQGAFDVPANYGVGMAFKAAPATTVAMDVERIMYGDVPSIANNLYYPPSASQMLGANGGSGFGWQNMTVFKIGVSQIINPTLTVRAGFNHNNQQIPVSQTFFNILAPGVVQNHATLGATWTLANKSELTVAYMHAFSTGVYGSNSIPTGFGGGNANLFMHEDTLGIAYGW